MGRRVNGIQQRKFVVCIDLWDTLAITPPKFNFLELLINAGVSRKEVYSFVRDSIMTRRYTSYERMVDIVFKHFSLSNYKEEYRSMIHQWKSENQNPYYFSRAHAFLKELRKDATLVLVTNVSYLAWSEVKKKLKIQEYFDRIFLSWEQGIAKPNPAVWRRIQKWFPKTNPDHFWMIGNNWADDLAVPNARGWRVLQIQDGKFPRVDRILKS